MSAQPYAVLIGDLSRSRRVPDRRRLQEVFAHELVSANRTFRKNIVSRLSIVLGDEYQGVFRTPATALLAAIRIARDLHPAKLHHGIGVGTISTKVDAEYPGRMDGPAFHRARAAVSQSQRKRHWLTLEGIGPVEDELISASISLWGRIWESWTPRQRDVIDTVEKVPDQSSAAKRLRVAPSSISNVLQAAKYHELDRLKAAAVTFLEDRFPHGQAGAP